MLRSLKNVKVGNLLRLIKRLYLMAKRIFQNQISPMMAAGKTDHIWFLEELLTLPYYKTLVN